MGIREIVENALGYVTEQDKQMLRASEERYRQQIEDARAGRTKATAMNRGVNTMLDMGQDMARGQLTGETAGKADSRLRAKQIKQRIITEEITTKDADDLMYGG